MNFGNFLFLFILRVCLGTYKSVYFMYLTPEIGEINTRERNIIKILPNVLVVET